MSVFLYKALLNRAAGVAIVTCLAQTVSADIGVGAGVGVGVGDGVGAAAGAGVGIGDGIGVGAGVGVGVGDGIGVGAGVGVGVGDASASAGTGGSVGGTSGTGVSAGVGVGLGDTSAGAAVGVDPSGTGDDGIGVGVGVDVGGTTGHPSGPPSNPGTDPTDPSTPGVSNPPSASQPAFAVTSSGNTIPMQSLVGTVVISSDQHVLGIVQAASQVATGYMLDVQLNNALGFRHDNVKVQMRTVNTRDGRVRLKSSIWQLRQKLG
ncbi:hypothetical protein [Pseudooceanicola sp.]|uniref:hypothetical protein n=1 Tax=Pseudooceanicola sp. TaxID=1914328 RepID=UPI003518C2D0